ncbi:MAG TPA: glycosyltransferase, partial [Aggregatilineaceae bacterium]|nr:glycosyltransferase [Aggregatilineaceae bacterium]
RLSIVGSMYDTNYVQQLRRLATDLNVSDRVEFLGERQDVPRLMQQAAAVMLCSESEAFGYVILEAMAARVPVIASRCGGPEEIIVPGKTGFLVDVGDIEGYVRALCDIVLNTDTTRQMKTTARQRAEQLFSAETMVGQIGDVFKGLQ